MEWALTLQRQQPHSCAQWIDSHQGAISQFRCQLIQRSDHGSAYRFGTDIPGSKLNHAGPGERCSSQHGAEVQIVGQHDLAVHGSVRHQHGISGVVRPQHRPVERFQTPSRQGLHPAR